MWGLGFIRAAVIRDVIMVIQNSKTSKNSHHTEIRLGFLGLLLLIASFFVGFLYLVF